MTGKWNIKVFCGLIVSLIVSFCNFFPNYDKPAQLFWDENYHIASAQRYLNNVFFLEPHPPLGKLLIAAGEAILKANNRNDQFITQEKISETPKDFSFSGYRLIPVLSAVLIGPLIFLILYLTTNSIFISFVISLFPALDNALIVHSRGAMLEAPQLMFILLAIICYTRVSSGKHYPLIPTIFLGVFSAASVCIKINCLAIFVFPLVNLLQKRNLFSWLLKFLLPCLLTCLLVWQAHFYIVTKIVPDLDDNGYFGVSPSYKQLLLNHSTSSLTNLIPNIKEYFDYFLRYQKGVPQLDYCKEDENGSDPFFWPIGSRSINYRWEDTGNKTSYLYLAANPATWITGLLGVLSGCIFFILKIFPSRQKLLNHKLITVILLVYFASWMPTLLAQRVLYLYHYFIPLIFSWLLAGLILNNLPKIIQKIIGSLSLLLSIICFVYFSPLTYYKPISDQQLQKRSWFWFWDIRCKNCKSEFLRFCNSDKNQQPKTDPTWSLSIAGTKSNYIEQSHGTPMQTENELEILTRSKIQFPINKKYSILSGIANLASDNISQDVEFKIIADGKTLWRSILNINKKPKGSFQLNLTNYSVLTFTVKNVNSLSQQPSAAKWRIETIK